MIDEDLRVVIFQYPPEVSPNWYVQYNDPLEGQKQESLRTRNKGEAKRRAWQLVMRLQKGEHAKRLKTAPKIADAIDSFLNDKLRTGKKETTITEYRRTLTQFRTFLASQRVSAMDRVEPELLEAFEVALRKNGIKVPRDKNTRGARTRANCGGTVREKIKLVKAFYKWAQRRRLLAENPIEGYDLPADTPPDNYCFTAQEVNAICAVSEPFFADVFRFLAFTGLRQSELFWLTKDDFDPNRRVVRIRAKRFAKEGLSWSPKNDARDVPLCKEAIEIAAKMLAQSPSRWLFSAPRVPGTKDDRLRAYRPWRQLQEAKKKAGIKAGKLHSFRHFFVSRMANAGESPFKVMKIVGHKSLDIILTYYHVGEAELVAAVDRVDFSEITSNGGVKTATN